MFLVSRANLLGHFLRFFLLGLFFFFCTRKTTAKPTLVLAGNRFHFSNCENTKTCRFYRSPCRLPWNSGILCAGQTAQSGFSGKPERAWLAKTTTLAIGRYFLSSRKISPEFHGSIIETFDNCCFSLEIRLFVESETRNRFSGSDA